jgi:cytochrome P450
LHPSFQYSLSILLNRVIHFLLDHPKWFDDIYQELKSEIGDEVDSASASSLAHLPILNAVINETLRIIPPASQDFDRYVPSGGANFGGYFIPERCAVTLQMYTVHNDPKLWEDPDKFMPERWLKDQPTDALDEIFPFSRGVRVCLGRNLAMTEMRLLLAMLVYHFTFERVPGDNMEPSYMFLTWPTDRRLRVKVAKRIH